MERYYYYAHGAYYFDHGSMMHLSDGRNYLFFVKILKCELL